MQTVAYPRASLAALCSEGAAGTPKSASGSAPGAPRERPSTPNSREQLGALKKTRIKTEKTQFFQEHVKSKEPYNRTHTRTRQRGSPGGVIIGRVIYNSTKPKKRNFLNKSLENGLVGNRTHAGCRQRGSPGQAILGPSIAIL